MLSRCISLIFIVSIIYARVNKNFPTANYTIMISFANVPSFVSFIFPTSLANFVQDASYVRKSTTFKRPLILGSHIRDQYQNGSYSGSCSPSFQLNRQRLLSLSLSLSFVFSGVFGGPFLQGSKGFSGPERVGGDGRRQLTTADSLEVQLSNWSWRHLGCTISLSFSILPAPATPSSYDLSPNSC